MGTVVKVPGAELTLGGEKFVLAPLAAGPLKQILPRLQGFGESDDPSAALDLAVDVAFHSLKRNYPDITRDRVENELVDLTNMLEIINAGAGISGLKPKGGAGTGEA